MYADLALLEVPAEEGTGPKGEREISSSVRGSLKEDGGINSPSVLFVDEDQVEVVPRRELLVDIPEGRCELETSEEESDGDGLACDEGEGREREGQLVEERRGRRREVGANLELVLRP